MDKEKMLMALIQALEKMPDSPGESAHMSGGEEGEDPKGVEVMKIRALGMPSHGEPDQDEGAMKMGMSDADGDEDMPLSDAASVLEMMKKKKMAGMGGGSASPAKEYC